MYDDEMIEDLAEPLRKFARRSGGAGLRVSLEWLRDALNGDERLARKVLRRAGFHPPEATFFSTGEGGKQLHHFTYPEALSGDLTEIHDDYCPY
ncbi:hypothetical protein, partial [Salipiger aestuarii]|uniref:hypothetical protein n=1 Tax=Salipiger aestuarii TaxID=568098 RepID=UPI00123B516F